MSLKETLKRKFDSAVYDYYDTLFEAARNDNANEVKKFLRFNKRGVNVRRHSGLGGTWTPLHEAAFLDRAESAKVLLNYGADANARSFPATDTGETPLITLAHLGNTGKMIDVLMPYNINMNALNEFGFSALHLTALTTNLTLAQNLLKHGADVFLKAGENKKSDTEGLTARGLAQHQLIRRSHWSDEHLKSLEDFIDFLGTEEQRLTNGNYFHSGTERALHANKPLKLQARRP